MGGRHSACYRCEKWKSSNGSKVSSRGGSYIVPDQDPLLKSLLNSSNGRLKWCKLAQDFELHPTVLGTGYSGAVHLATSKCSGQQVAVKQFWKRRLHSNRLQLLQNEVEVYLRLDHPNICRLLHAYESKTKVWLVMELCGCSLYSRLRETKVYLESDAADVMLQMLQAVNYLHSHHIVHRDLKLENWMYGATERDNKLKLIDFGFSRLIAGADETLDMRCGTLLYTSPEVLARRYTSKCDLWSLGVICFMLLIGKPPFRGTGRHELAHAIIHDDFRKDSRWMKLPSDAQSFVMLLLQKHASKRPAAMEALAHPWIVRAANSTSCKPGPESVVDVVTNLQRYADGSHLRRVALTLLACSLTSRELQDFEDTFLAFDKSGRGSITKEQLAEVMREQMKIPAQEISRIFVGLDCCSENELRYTTFIAAMVASRIKLHEDKVRVAFEAFDHDGSGYITAENLTNSCSGQPRGPPNMIQERSRLSKHEAELWIREVDYKGNGVIDYDSFLLALMGRKLWPMPSLLDAAQLPTVRIFDGQGGNCFGVSSSFFNNVRPRPVSAVSPRRVLHESPSLNTDGDWELSYDDELDIKRACSFQPDCQSPFSESKLRIRTVNCIVDDRHFARGWSP